MPTAERSPLLGAYEEPPKGKMQKVKTFLQESFKGRNALLLMYLGLVVVAGTTNRVTFKIAQLSTMNYAYFLSQITTFIYVPINFIVIFFKTYYTKSITPEMKNFPKYKFAVMGFLDSLQGLLIVVGGTYVPGVMQSLLLQGVVPVTMLFSIAMLRPGGCDSCKIAKKKLKLARVHYKEVSSLPKNCDGECVCRVMVDGAEVDIDKLQGHHVEGRQVVLETSSRDWLDHIKHFYQLNQYIGAAIIVSGIIVSMIPNFSSNKAGNGSAQWDMIFFSATIPTAISGVYKEIAFRDAEDMDVWFLNGWVALFQFLFGLTYAPLAAKMGGLAIKDIPVNLWHGLECWLIGTNFITTGCDTSGACGPDPQPLCCDSCDGSLAGISAVPTFWALTMYMVANISYNVFLVLVIKYGSAALMYIGSTLVLPISSVCFTFKRIMGRNARAFTRYDLAGLITVLAGLIIYRFLGRKKNLQSAVMVGGMHEPIFMDKPVTPSTHKPRTRAQIRNNYYSRLGLAADRINEVP